MTELERREESTDTRQLILGFDAGCGTCSDLAGSIQERVGEKLAVRNLNDPELLGWREQALGKDARWAPTLFEVNGSEVRAWTGWKMGFALSRAIGPAATWQVMQALGEVGAAPRIEESPVVEKLPGKAAEAAIGMSRGQFLKGVGGAAVAMSILSSADILITSAEAAKKKRPYDVVKAVILPRSRAIDVAIKTAGNRDVKKVAGERLATRTKVKASKPEAYIVTLRDGRTARAVVYRLSKSQYLSHYKFSKKPKQGSDSVAQLWIEDKGTAVVLKASEGGELWRRARDSRQSRTTGIQPLAECPPVDGGSRPPGSCTTKWVNRCVKHGMSATCAGSGGATLGSCAGCALTIVGVAMLAAPSGGTVLIAAGGAIGLCSACVGGGLVTQEVCCVSREPVQVTIC